MGGGEGRGLRGDRGLGGGEEGGGGEGGRVSTSGTNEQETILSPPLYSSGVFLFLKLLYTIKNIRFLKVSNNKG
jgi:hypothetical protein